MTNCYSMTTSKEERVKIYIDMELEDTNQIEYQSLISSLIYYTLTKHDMSFFINCMTRCRFSSQEPHSQVPTSILKHIRGTKRM